MPIQPGDFTIALNFSGLSGTIESVIGKPTTLSILFSNNSLTDSLYNLGLEITLPDGVSYISSSHTATSSEIDDNFNNIIKFVGLKDLYSNELNYSVAIEIQIDEYLRSDENIPVDFMSVISGLLFSASADTKPRGSLDIGNQNISSSSFASATAYRYSVIFIGPTKYLKGAGETSDTSASGDHIFSPTIKIENNTRESSNLNLNLNLANGIRYVGDWNPSGPDSSKLDNPNIGPPSIGQNFTNINIPNINLQAGSSNEISFKASIWNNLTENGIENSGSEILHGQPLQSEISLESQGQYQYAYLLMEALILFFTKTLASPFTDWNIVNQFNITYTVSPYIGVNTFLLTNLIPDGLTFVESTPNIDSLINNGDGTTSITWDLGNISSGSTDSISFSLSTDTQYFDSSQTVCGDTFTSRLNGTFVHPTSGNLLTDSASKTVTIPMPSMSKEVSNYYYEDLTNKSTDSATVGDFIKFNVVYDASTIDATQKNVFLFEYPPLNMIMTSIPSYTTTGNFPTTAAFELISDNGLMINLGDISGGTYFEIDFIIEVTEAETSKTANNLAKISLDDSNNISTSIRDLATITFGSPNLKYTHTLNGPDCVVYNNNFNYEIKIKNLPKGKHTNLTDAFNLISETIFPDIFSITHVQVSSSSAPWYDYPTTLGNTVNFIIHKLPPDEIITVDIFFKATSLPIMNESYKIKSTMNRGTSQETDSSFNYEGDEIVKNQNILACGPSITKEFISPIVDAGENFLNKTIVSIPRGLLAYNVEINDELVTSDSSRIENILLDGSPVSSSISNGNLIVPLVQTLDTTASSKNYTLTYNDAIYDITPIDYEENFEKTSTIKWSNDIATSSTDSIDDTSNLLVFAPELEINKYQRNYTKNTLFSKATLAADLNDTVLYKIRLENIGKSTAYNIQVTDILDSDLTFVRLLVGTGSFNIPSNTLTISADSLQTGYYTELLIETKVNGTAQTKIALNDAVVSYTLSENETDIYATHTSNSITLLEEIFELKKEQRNVTLETPFSYATLSVVKEQIFQYKIILENFNDTTLTNIVITDTFPIEVDFIDFEPFTDGSLSISSNTVTATISSVAPNETIEFIYNLKLNVDTLKRKSSHALISFSTPSDSEAFNINSNVIYTNFSALGRGFKVY